LLHGVTTQLEIAAYWKAKYERERELVYDLRRSRDLWRERAKVRWHESDLAARRHRRAKARAA
jgi:predicted flap endonuclease-1-like 5' DNA nuclease